MYLKLLYNIIVLALVDLAFISCNKENDEIVTARPIEVAIRASHTDATRTQLGSVGVGSQGSSQLIKWSVGDQLRVWAKKAENNDYVINGAIFKLATYNSTFTDADFMSTLDQSMSAGEYIYYGTYPAPAASNVSGKQVSYTIPSSQNGDYNPALDVMVASAAGRELVRYDESYFGPEMPSLNFRHLFHLIRLRIPEGANSLDDGIKHLTIIFPNDVVGTAKFDVTNPDNIIWENCSNKITIDLPDNDLLNANGRYVWLHIKPGVQNGRIRYRACSKSGVISGELGTTINKDFRAQHITPLSITIPESDENANIEVTLSCPDTDEYPNFLGENANTMYVREWPASLKAIKSQSMTLTSTNGVFKARFYYLNTDEYQFNTVSNNASMSVSFDSANADMDDIDYNLVMPNFCETQNVYYALPYLYFEDFAYMDSDCTTEVDTDTNIAGVLLDAKYFNPIQNGKYGWTGSNIIGNSGSITLNAKSEIYIGSSAVYRGRLDSSQLPMTGTATVAVSFDYICSAGTAFTPNMTYGQTTEASPIQAHTYRVVAIKYNYGNKVSGTEKSLSAGESGVQTYTISNCTGSHRLSWDVFGSNGSGNTSENQTLTLDNIKVSIGGEVKHTNLDYRKYFPKHTN